MAKHSLFSICLTLSFLGFIQPLKAQELLTASVSTPSNAGVLSEGCTGPYSLVFERGAGNTGTVIIFISDIGDAMSGLDYTFPAGTFPLQMLPTDTLVAVPITVINDGLTEGLESLVWEIAYTVGLESGVFHLFSGIVDEYEVEILSPSDTIQWCRNAPLSLSASSNALVHWSPTPFFDPQTGADVIVSPLISGWYYASVGSDSCGAKDSVYLDLAIVEILNGDTVFICLDGPGIVLQGQLDGLASGFEWIPSDSTLSQTDILTPVANPVITTTYILQSDFGVCIAADTILVRVDSIPEDQHIAIAPFKAYYCQGEVVALFSPSFDSLAYPDLVFDWTPDNGTFLTDRSLLNAALELQDTTLYIRSNINNACVTSDSILINVIPFSVPISVTDTILCPGEMFQVSVLSTQVIEPEWTPGDGLSCTKCLEPTVTVLGNPGSTVFYQFSGKILGCPVGAQLLIQIPSIQQIGIIGDPVVCQGDMVPLTITNPEGLSGFQWSVEHGNATLSCTNCPDPVVTVNANETINILVSANTSNPNFCGAQGFIQLLTGQRPQVAGPPIAACIGGTAIASTGDPTLSNIQWSVFSGNLSLSCTSCENPTVTVNSPGQLQFTAESDDPDICRVLGTVAVGIFPPDQSLLTVVPDPNAEPIGQGSNVMIILTVSPSAPTSVTWTINGNNISANTTTIEVSAANEINFIVARYINSKGCEQIDTISFPTVPPSYMIPNAFTPDNGDDINDKFRIIITGNIALERFLIFNRWGQKVYEASGGNLEGWDGRINNTPAASDTYVYMATLRLPDGRLEVAKGDVILLR